MTAAALASVITMPAGSREYVSAWFNDPASVVSIQIGRGFTSEPHHVAIETELKAKEARILARFLLEAASKIEEGQR